MAQIEGSALKISADALRREFKRGGELQELILCFNSLLTQIGWGFLQPISLERATAGALKGDGRRRGVVRRGIDPLPARQDHDYLDEAGLESAACDCNRVIREDSESFLAA